MVSKRGATEGTAIVEPRRVRRRRDAEPREREDAAPEAERAAPAEEPPEVDGAPAADPAPEAPHTVHRVAPRGVVSLAALGLLTAVVAATVTSRLLAATGRAAPPAPTAPPAAAWATLPGAGAADTAVSIAADPSGGLWLVEAVPDAGGWQLFRATGSAAAGGWTVAPVPAAAGGVVIQTVGQHTVWLAAGPQELSFDATTDAFHPYTSQPAVAVASVAGYSVAAYVPQDSGGSVTGPPYVLAAPLQSGAATRIALPGAPTPGALPAATVVAGPSGTALVAVGQSVWSITPADGRAQTWGTLPSGADAATAAWGAGKLWVEVPNAAEPTGPPTVVGVAPGGSATALGAARTSPPALGGGLVFASHRLWWSGSAAVLAWDPASGRLERFDLPAGVAGPALLAGGPGGAVWAAAADRFARLAP